MTALIVEDEPLMREYLMLNLTSIHSEWITKACAKDGVEAISLLSKEHFDLVITDIKMPHMSGLELAAYVQRNVPGTDVVFLTGYDEFDYARTAVRTGVADYLLKPLQDAELHSILDKLAAKHHQRNEPSNNSNATITEANAKSSGADTDDPSVLVQRTRDYIQRHFSEPISLNAVADAMHVNPAYLSSIFKSERGESYSKYVLRLRMERAALLLRTHSVGKVSDIAIEVGYFSTKHFDAVFKKYYGVTPNTYRNTYSNRMKNT